MQRRLRLDRAQLEAPVNRDVDLHIAWRCLAIEQIGDIDKEVLSHESRVMGRNTKCIGTIGFLTLILPIRMPPPSASPGFGSTAAASLLRAGQ